MGAVGHYLLTSFGIHFQELGGIQYAGISVCLAGFAQDEGGNLFFGVCSVQAGVHSKDGLHLFVKFLLQETFILHQVNIQGIVVVGKTVRHNFQIPELRRKTPERLNQAGIAFYFHIQR